MSNGEDDIRAAASKLTDAMSGLLRAIDAVADEGATARDIPDALPGDLERLASAAERRQGVPGLTE